MNQIARFSALSPVASRSVPFRGRFSHVRPGRHACSLSRCLARVLPPPSRGLGLAGSTSPGSPSVSGTVGDLARCWERVADLCVRAGCWSWYWTFGEVLQNRIGSCRSIILGRFIYFQLVCLRRLCRWNRSKQHRRGIALRRRITETFNWIWSTVVIFFVGLLQNNTALGLLRCWP